MKKTLTHIMLAVALSAGLAGCATSPNDTRTSAQIVEDASITAKIKTALLADPRVSGLKIDVDTVNQVVTLSGNVENATARQAALNIAASTPGVRQVRNALR